MWVQSGNTAYNLDHASRLYVEETGSGAALKIDQSGKTLMVAYFSNREEAQKALSQILERREAGAQVVRL